MAKPSPAIESCGIVVLTHCEELVRRVMAVGGSHCYEAGATLILLVLCRTRCAQVCDSVNDLIEITNLNDPDRKSVV